MSTSSTICCDDANARSMEKFPVPAIAENRSAASNSASPSDRVIGIKFGKLPSNLQTKKPLRLLNGTAREVTGREKGSFEYQLQAVRFGACMARLPFPAPL
jgi:hypothetical protein